MILSRPFIRLNILIREIGIPRIEVIYNVLEIIKLAIIDIILIEIVILAYLFNVVF